MMLGNLAEGEREREKKALQMKRMGLLTSYGMCKTCLMELEPGLLDLFGKIRL